MRVLVPASLRAYWGGGARADVDAKELGDAIRALGPLATRVLDDTGEVRPHVHLFVNQVASRRLDVALAEGDIIHILPAVSGGST
ncbi:MAG TPA: MoaD/ThiS family protein [Candidatus Thermoplasmatota archaeon]|nr:MoaD/ThiS family protein [Candidatus Thermoplasmatota archaeon]